MARRSIEVDSFKHVNPIPSACRIGPLLVSSVIAGRDVDGKTVPADPGAQFANCFHHIGEMLREAGGDWRHVARITFYVPDIKFRDACNPVWVEYFPDPASRPARHTQISSGPAVTCEFMAYIED
jgi:2-iminobutanoate/2-iminopropanoate deaminase